MDVTPSDKMYHAMKALTDAVCGEEPHQMLVGRQIDAIRGKRLMMMDILHKLVAVSMREGVRRAVKEAQERRQGIRPSDNQDRSAVDQAKDDAAAGSNRIRLPT